MVHAKEYLNLSTPDGYTPLHYAASKGHTQVCSLLAAQVKPFQLELYTNIAMPLYRNALSKCELAGTYWFKLINFFLGFGKYQPPISQNQGISTALGHRRVTLECSGVPRWLGSTSQSY